MGRLGRFSSRHRKCVNKDAAANVEAKGENQEAERREDGSPSSYLNLDQDAEAEEVAPEVCETTSEPSHRGKRGPNKMPKRAELLSTSSMNLENLLIL
ncbi:hypothetical protein GQ55_5G358500 [Panicum hallii var. hallii]|uniref:Uncharacterized protein n=1 Tax=Panicum hallii var. hallii TaxID=1504633 RepID=A0A2T7DMC8_9POAL|nr:hypothetical protein GQ55_5G358500 [Panicum hallii var. hallii]